MAVSASPLDWEGRTLLDRDGEKIGTIDEIFLVEETGRPEWALVKVGRLRSHATLVPLTGAQPVEDGIKIGFGKGVVGDAPPIEAGEEPSEQEVRAVYRHYGIDDGAPSSSNGSSSSNGHAHGDLREHSFPEVVKTVADDAKTLASTEVKLAKAEMTGKVKDVGIGAGMFGGAGYVAHLAALGLMLTIIFALATAMEAWLAALVVTVVFAAIAGVLAVTGRKRIKRAGPPIPQHTLESIKETVETVKEEAKWGLSQTSR